MKIVTFDLGTNTGIATLEEDGKITSTCINLSPKKDEKPGVRFNKFYNLVKSTITGADLVVYEDVCGHGRDGLYAAHLYGGFKAIVLLLCEEYGIEYTSIHTGTLKKAITGKGNAKKDEMINAAVTVHGWKPTLLKKKKTGVIEYNDNECDAYCLLVATMKNQDILKDKEV